MISNLRADPLSHGFTPPFVASLAKEEYFVIGILNNSHLEKSWQVTADWT